MYEEYIDRRKWLNKEKPSWTYSSSQKKGAETTIPLLPNPVKFIICFLIVVLSVFIAFLKFLRYFN